MGHPNEELVRRYLDAFNQMDLEEAASLFDEEVVVRYPARSRLGGTYRGRSGLLEFWRKHLELSGGTFRAEVFDMLANDRHVVLLADVRAGAAGAVTGWRRVAVFRVARGRFAEVWVQDDDPDLADRVFAGAAGERPSPVTAAVKEGV
ncbi:MAG: nuclear transport factor 2 family protein [Actinomycetota bacterium]